MRIDVTTYKEKHTDKLLSDNAVIVIDVLRCTSAVIAALENGADKVVPFVEPGAAAALAAGIGRSDCVLGGERGCNPLPGFDVGNSPFEYSKNRVKGKTVVISTSNGSAAICGVGSAKEVFLGALSNSKACASAAAASGRDVLIVCSGTDGMVSADDCCAAGSIIGNILAAVPGCELTDIAMICLHLYRGWKEGTFDLLSTRHCARLINLGYGEDVEYCLTEDSTTLVPVYREGIITAM